MQVLSLQYSKEELSEMSLIEIAYEIMLDKKKAIPFSEIIEELKKLLGHSDEEIKSKIAQFYTDLNIDGRFLSLGENQWGLRIWYPVDQVVEEIVNPVKAKKKKKAKKKVVEEDLDFDDDDEDEFDEDGFDKVEDLIDDDDLDDDDLDDDDDDDLDEDLDEVIDDDLDDDIEEIDEDLIDEDLEEDEFEIDEEEEDLDDKSDSK